MKNPNAKYYAASKEPHEYIIRYSDKFCEIYAVNCRTYGKWRLEMYKRLVEERDCNYGDIIPRDINEFVGISEGKNNVQALKNFMPKLKEFLKHYEEPKKKKLNTALEAN